MPLLNICHIEMMDQISTRILWVFYVSADYAMSVHTFYPVCVMQCDVSGPFAVAELFVKKYFVSQLSLIANLSNAIFFVFTFASF